MARLETIELLYNSLDDAFKKEIEGGSIIPGDCLFKLLKVPSSITLNPLVETLLEYYNCEENVFYLGRHRLSITLEDVLYLTGLPIRGKPVICSKTRDKDAFNRVFGLKRTPKNLSFPELRSIAVDQKRDFRQRKIAVLLTLISCFIVPNSDGHRFDTTYVQLVENLEDVNSYAWGAALLAYLYTGIKKWKEHKKNSISGNLWVLLSFFLIRIPRLRDAISIELALEDRRVPLMSWVVEKVKIVSHNHKANYKNVVNKILENLCDEDILWSPYTPSLLPLPLRDQVRFGTLLAPLFCNNHVVHHRPHLAARQFAVFQDYSQDNLVSKVRWTDYKIKSKQNRGRFVLDFLSFYAKEIQLWDKGQLAQDLILEENTKHRRCKAPLEKPVSKKPRQAHAPKFELKKAKSKGTKIEVIYEISDDELENETCHLSGLNGENVPTVIADVYEPDCESEGVQNAVKSDICTVDGFYCLNNETDQVKAGRLVPANHEDELKNHETWRIYAS